MGKDLLYNVMMVITLMVTVVAWIVRLRLAILVEEARQIVLILVLFINQVN